MPDKPTLICRLALCFLAACGSCREESADPPASSGSQYGTTTAPAEPAANHPATRPIDANPLAGCDMCHLDVADRMALGKHLANGVGCTTCHGPSEGHVADETNAVKPDRTFTREQTESFCVQCHKCTRPTATQPAAASPADRKVCIDCHRPH